MPGTSSRSCSGSFRGGHAGRAAAIALAALALASARLVWLPAALVRHGPPLGLLHRPSIPRHSRGRSAAAAGGAAGVDELFAALQGELESRTPLHEELGLVMDAGRRAAEDVAVVEMFRGLLEWLRAQPPSTSLGPLSAAALRHPKSGREVIVLGTLHSAAGMGIEQNPVPAAVRRAIARLKPDIVAVELDEARGTRELEGLPSSLWGRAPVLLPSREPGGDNPWTFDWTGSASLRVERELVDRVVRRLGPQLQSHAGLLEATREIFAESDDSCLAMNVFALREARGRQANDYGKDATAAVAAAAKAGVPLLFCDLPQERTMGKVVPLYNNAWLRGRQVHLEWLGDRPCALRVAEAEDKILAERLMSGNGGDLPSLDHAMKLCSPGTGPGEAEVRSVWLQSRDEAMAAAVADAQTEGRARSASGGAASLPPAERIVLMVGAYHVQGVAGHLRAAHGYEDAAAPRAGWPSVSPGASKRGARRAQRPAPGRAGFR
ncbi:unnamed protein product [Prorocentrum cordatum]|uniref:TraB domain-containing protein n=1 Tax=Prorocentrum cordatum TaxID=2364126 RepID=A0ABN9TIZ9_9DINO|nr:unnamed protein product [Polarella glacialis]